MMKHLTRLGALLCLLACLCVCAAAEPRYPDKSGETTDAAGVLSHTTLEDLRTLDNRLDNADALRLKVVTVDFLDAADADDYAAALFERWRLDDEDMLLLLAVGEDKYAVHAGEDVNRLISPGIQSKLLATCLEEPFLQQEYDAAIAAFVPALVSEINKAYGESISTNGLFGRSSSSMFADWASKLQSGAQTIEEAADSFLTREDESTGFSLAKVILTIALLMIAFGSRKKNRKGSPFFKLLAVFGLFKLWKKR